MKDIARRTAYDVVLAVEKDGAYANLLLPRLLRERGLDRRDRAFAAELAYGTLRWQGVLDDVIASVAGREVATLDPPVRAVARLGAYQLLHMRTPPHAAVHATVELARAVAGPKPVGFVNAVLRKLSQDDWDGWSRRLAPRDEIGALAFRHGQPRWIADAFLDALDGDVADLTLLLAEDRPVTHLVARPGRIARDELLAQAGDGAVAGSLSPYAVRLDAGGDPSEIAAVRDGRAGVQDEGSQAVALAFARVPLDGRDERWLDLCAGPGGKSALLKGLLKPGGVLVSADLHPHRARLVADSSRPVVIADGTRSPWRDGAFDRVLVDVPCSGLGALRRRPEVRWRRTPDDIARVRPLQEALLAAALAAVRPGGVVGYVTCSPHRDETAAVVEAALARTPGAQRIDAWTAAGAPRGGRDGYDLQLWPHRHHSDAMFLALLRSGEL